MNRCRRCGCKCFDCCTEFVGYGGRESKKVPRRPRKTERSQRFLEHLRTSSQFGSHYGESDEEISPQEYQEGICNSDVAVRLRARGRIGIDHNDLVHRRAGKLYEDRKFPGDCDGEYEAGWPSVHRRQMVPKRIPSPKPRRRYQPASFLELERRCRESPAEVINPRELTSDAESDHYYKYPEEPRRRKQRKEGRNEIVQMERHLQNRCVEEYVRNVASPITYLHIDRPYRQNRSRHTFGNPERRTEYKSAVDSDGQRNEQRLQNETRNQKTTEKHVQTEYDQISFPNNRFLHPSALPPKVVNTIIPATPVEKAGSDYTSSDAHHRGRTTRRNFTGDIPIEYSDAEGHEDLKTNKKPSSIRKKDDDFLNASNDDDHRGIQSARSSVIFLRQTRQVQKMKQEWEAKLHHQQFTQTLEPSQSNKRKHRSRRVSKNPNMVELERLEVKPKVEIEVSVTSRETSDKTDKELTIGNQMISNKLESNVTPSENSTEEIDTSGSTRPEPGVVPRKDSLNEIETEDYSPQDLNKSFQTQAEAIPRSTATVEANARQDQQRDSYIESEDLKRLLTNSDITIETVSPKHQNAEINEVPTSSKDTSDISKLRSFAQKWKNYHRKNEPLQTLMLPQQNGLSFLEFHEAQVKYEALTTEQELLITQVKIEKTGSLEPPRLESPPPAEPVPPLQSSWWGFMGWGTTPAPPPPVVAVTEETEVMREGIVETELQSVKSSHSAITRFSYAMAIEGRNNSYKSHSLEDGSLTVDHGVDKIFKMEGRATSLKVKESKLEINSSFERMKSASQIDLSARASHFSLAHAHVRKSHSAEYFDLHCSGCHKLIDLKTDTSLIESHGYWHEKCFNCCICGGSLNEANHFWLDSHLYCIQHYAHKINAPKCAGCQQYILDSVYTQAKGKTWHKNHFRCAACNRPIIDTKFVSRKNNDVVCFKCHENYFSHKCVACGKRILPTDQFVFLKSTGNYWHANENCLQCNTCGQSLLNPSTDRLIFVKNGILYCNKYCAQRSRI